MQDQAREVGLCSDAKARLVLCVLSALTDAVWDSHGAVTQQCPAAVGFATANAAFETEAVPETIG